MIEIVPFEASHRKALLEVSLRAWEPVFPQMKEAVPSFVYDNFYPDGWRRRQYDDLVDVLDREPENVDVALRDGTAVGWVCTRLHPEDRMAEVYVLAVDPEYQRQGVGRSLMDHALGCAERAGMSMVMVETGGDPGHAPARDFYQEMGFERWPVARYFRDISDSAD